MHPIFPPDQWKIFLSLPRGHWGFLRTLDTLVSVWLCGPTLGGGSDTPQLSTLFSGGTGVRAAGEGSAPPCLQQGLHRRALLRLPGCRVWSTQCFSQTCTARPQNLGAHQTRGWVLGQCLGPGPVGREVCSCGAFGWAFLQGCLPRPGLRRGGFRRLLSGLLLAPTGAPRLWLLQLQGSRSWPQKAVGWVPGPSQPLLSASPSHGLYLPPGVHGF